MYQTAFYISTTFTDYYSLELFEMYFQVFMRLSFFIFNKSQI